MTAFGDVAGLHTASGGEIDPGVREVSPGEPFEFLLPDMTIQTGDIKRICVPGSIWEPISDGEVGHRVPRAGVAYARVAVPPNYQLSLDTRLVFSDGGEPEGHPLAWIDGGPGWFPVGLVIPYSTTMTCLEAKAKVLVEQNRRLFIAHQLPGTPSHIDFVIPYWHRQIFDREPLRQGDKVITAGMTEWRPIDPKAFGNRAALAGPENGYARYCRPIGPNHMHWYVNSQSGHVDNLGGLEDPWPDVNTALEKIKLASAAVGGTAVGILFDTDGSPRYVFDINVEQIPAEHLVPVLGTLPDPPEPDPEPHRTKTKEHPQADPNELPLNPVSEAQEPLTEFAPLTLDAPQTVTGPAAQSGMTPAEIAAAPAGSFPIEPTVQLEEHDVMLVDGAWHPIAEFLVGKPASWAETKVLRVPREAISESYKVPTAKITAAMKALPEGFTLVEGKAWPRKRDLLFMPAYDDPGAPWTWQPVTDNARKRPMSGALIARKVETAVNRALPLLMELKNQLADMTAKVDKAIAELR